MNYLSEYIKNGDDNIIDYDQLVEVHWHSTNKDYYVSKGYVYTKMKDAFMVKVKDLPPKSQVKYFVVCDICGETYYTSNNILCRSENQTLNTCNKCHIIKSCLTKNKKNIENIWGKVEQVCEDKGYVLLSKKDDYKNRDSLIFYNCPIHGECSSTCGNFIKGHCCYQCGRNETGNKTRSDKNKIIKYIESINNNKLLNPDEYINAHEPNLIVLCGCCGKNTFKVSYHNYKRTTQRCRECSLSMSSNEYKISNYLKSNNINFIPEKTFKDCRDILPLPFDFYIPDKNLCIEFDGEQHFNPNYDITMKLENPYEAFEKRQYHDKIKTEYCVKNGINLLRIPYWEENNIESIINNKLNSLKQKI